MLVEFTIGGGSFLWWSLCWNGSVREAVTPYHCVRTSRIKQHCHCSCVGSVLWILFAVMYTIGDKSIFGRLRGLVSNCLDCNLVVSRFLF